MYRKEELIWGDGKNVEKKSKTCKGGNFQKLRGGI